VEGGLLERRQKSVGLDACRVSLRLGVGMLGQRLGLRCEVVDEAVVVCGGRGARDVERSSRNVAQF
jgi:hypothetical protein